MEIGVRPEDVRLVAPDVEGALRGEVYVVEPMGNETLVDVRIAESIVTVRAQRGWNEPIGAPVAIQIDPKTTCLFDAQGVTRVHRTDRGHPSERSST